jgi:streptomycin 6-kinase
MVHLPCTRYLPVPTIRRFRPGFVNLTWPHSSSNSGAISECYGQARELASNGPEGLIHGDLHLSDVLRAGRSRGLVAIDPRPGVGDPTFDAIDWTLDR